MIPNRIDNRIVIDTNVCLDLFLFRDLRWAGLLAALGDGRLEAVTRTDCRKEWLLVLDYPHLRVRPEQRPEVAARFDAAITCLAENECPPQPFLLPVCKDRDDQKFLEIARDAGAAVLLTKDKALLKLAKRTIKRGLFRIAHPEAWIKEAGLESAEDTALAVDVRDGLDALDPVNALTASNDSNSLSLSSTPVTPVTANPPNVLTASDCGVAPQAEASIFQNLQKP